MFASLQNSFQTELYNYFLIISKIYCLYETYRIFHYMS